MRLMLLQLSDIHLKVEARKNTVLGRAEIAEAVLGVEDDVAGYVIVMSGDTAFSGKPEEYEHGLTFYTSIIDTLFAQFPNKPIAFAIVPGNHDCNFDSEDSTRSLLLANLKVDDLKDDSPVSHCQQVQTGYFAFVKRMISAILETPQSSD